MDERSVACDNSHSSDDGPVMGPLVAQFTIAKVGLDPLSIYNWLKVGSIKRKACGLVVSTYTIITVSFEAWSLAKAWLFRSLLRLDPFLPQERWYLDYCIMDTTTVAKWRVHIPHFGGSAKEKYYDRLFEALLTTCTFNPSCTRS
jgi:hypothetical protein